MAYLLGKLPAIHDPRDLMLKKYIKKPFPARPKDFGHEDLIGDWKVLGNDFLGNCTVAGAAHEHMIWGAEGQNLRSFSTENIIKAYSDITGYDPKIPDSDRGAYVLHVMRYRRNIGILDEHGVPHKLEAFVRVEERDFDDVLDCLYLFGAVGIGFNVPDYAMDQFDNRKVWEYKPNGRVDGGHYVPIVAYRNGLLICVTWGRLQAMTKEFFLEYCDEAWGMLSKEMFFNGKTKEGFDFDKLNEDLKIIAA